MAISMVRKPSETPNMNNIDDIIPFRYAYGNQDGYVIGRGAEISHTVNGNQFIINSGRLVVQGVESDIDANGVRFTIDNISSLRYFTVYYKVNLATNTTSIEIISDSATFPTIQNGDDLTENSSGIAQLVLYRFTATSGVISNVEKVAKPIKYAKDIEVESSKRINGIEIKSVNGVLKAGDIIIPQKRLLFESNEGLNISGENNNIFQDSNSLLGRTFEIEFSINIATSNLGSHKLFTKFKLKNNANVVNTSVWDGLIDPYSADQIKQCPAYKLSVTTDSINTNNLIIGINKIDIYSLKYSDASAFIYKVYEIIE